MGSKTISTPCKDRRVSQGKIGEGHLRGGGGGVERFHWLGDKLTFNQNR